ncbi:MAG: hypothetical protein WBS54_15025 [Acidobacteriota bacterium]
MPAKLSLILGTMLMMLIGTVAIGSNMGFKIVIPLVTGTNNYISLPYYTQYTDAYSLAIDIKGSDTTTATVNRWDPTTKQVQYWNSNGRGSANGDFMVTGGEGYWVTITSAKTTPWIVVGSHNPSLVIHLVTGTNNYISVPYHTTQTTAYGLAVEIKGQSAATVTANRWNTTTRQVEYWNSNGRGSAGGNFAITPGEGYWITTTVAVDWQPSHY